MSWFSKAVGVVKKVAAPVAGIVGPAIGGPAGAAVATLGAAVSGVKPATMAKVPGIMPGGAVLGLPSTTAGLFPGITGIAQQMTLPGFRGMAKTKTGRLSGAQIPRGFVERMSKSGVIYLSKIGRRRGINSRDLSTYRRVDRLLHRYADRAHRAPRAPRRRAS